MADRIGVVGVDVIDHHRSHRRCRAQDSWRLKTILFAHRVQPDHAVTGDHLAMNHYAGLVADQRPRAKIKHVDQEPLRSLNVLVHQQRNAPSNRGRHGIHLLYRLNEFCHRRDTDSALLIDAFHQAAQLAAQRLVHHGMAVQLGLLHRKGVGPNATTDRQAPQTLRTTTTPTGEAPRC